VTNDVNPLFRDMTFLLTTFSWLFWVDL